MFELLIMLNDKVYAYLTDILDTSKGIIPDFFMGVKLKIL